MFVYSLDGYYKITVRRLLNWADILAQTVSGVPLMKTSQQTTLSESEDSSAGISEKLKDAQETTPHRVL
jgi:hypothetical protein